MPKASPARSRAGTACPSSTSARTSASRPTPPSSSRCGRSSASSRSRRRAPTSGFASPSRTPANIHGIDELRLATRYPIDLGVASREDIVAELERAIAPERRSSRRSPPSTRSRSSTRTRTISRPTTASPMPRSSVSSTRSSCRPRPTAPATSTSSRRRTRSRPRPRRRRAHRGAADPEADGERRHDPSQGAREARHRRAPQAAGRPDLAERARGRAHARHPRRRAADGRGRAGRDAPDRQVAEDADARVARPLRGDARQASRDHPPADRRAARHRPDRLR